MVQIEPQFLDAFSENVDNRKPRVHTKAEENNLDPIKVTEKNEVLQNQVGWRFDGKFRR